MSDIRLDRFCILPESQSYCFRHVSVSQEAGLKMLVLQLNGLGSTTYMHKNQPGVLHALMMFHFIATERVKKEDCDLHKTCRCFLEHVRSDSGRIVGARIFLITNRDLLGMEDAMFARNRKQMRKEWHKVCPCYGTCDLGTWIQNMDRLFGDLGGLHNQNNAYDLERLFVHREIPGGREVQQDLLRCYVNDNNEWQPPSPLDIVELLPKDLRPEKFSKMYRRQFQNMWMPPIALRVHGAHLVDPEHPLVRSLDLTPLEMELDDVYRDLVAVDVGHNLARFREKTLSSRPAMAGWVGTTYPLYDETSLDWECLEAKEGECVENLDIVEYLKRTDMPPEQKVKEFLTILMDPESGGLPDVGKSAAKLLAKPCEPIFKFAYADLTLEGNILVLLANTMSENFYERRVDRDVFMISIIRTLALMRRRQEKKEPNLCIILTGVGGTGKTRWMNELLEEFVLKSVMEPMDIGSALVETVGGHMHSRIVTQGEGQYNLFKPDTSKAAQVNASNALKMILSDGKITTKHLDIDHDKKERVAIVTKRVVEQIRVMCENHLRRADLKGTPFERRCYVLLFKQQNTGLYGNGKDDVRSYEAAADEEDKDDTMDWTNFFRHHHAWTYVICTLIHIGAVQINMDIFSIIYNKLKKTPGINMALTKRFCEAHCIFMAIAKVLYTHRMNWSSWKGFRDIDETHENFMACVREIESHLYLTEEHMIYVISFMEDEIIERDDQIMRRALYETYMEKRTDNYHYAPTGEMRREVDLQGRELNKPVLDYNYCFIQVNGRNLNDMAKRISPAIVGNVERLGGEIDVDSVKQFLKKLQTEEITSGVYSQEQGDLTGLARQNGLAFRKKAILDELISTKRGIKIATAYFEPFRDGQSERQGSIYGVLEDAFCYRGQVENTYIMGNLFTLGDKEDPRQLGVFRTKHTNNLLRCRARRPNQSRRYVKAVTNKSKRRRLQNSNGGVVRIKKYFEVNGNLLNYIRERGFSPAPIQPKTFQGELVNYQQIAKHEFLEAQKDEEERSSEDEEEIVFTDPEDSDEDDHANSEGQALHVEMGQNESGSSSEDDEDSSNDVDMDDERLDPAIRKELLGAMAGVRHGYGAPPALLITGQDRPEYSGGGHGFFENEAEDDG